jgi:vacuolar-type H+-ATPase subunit F/Vma7
VQFCCIADEETVRGFRLAGIAGHIVSNAAQAAAAVQQAAAKADCGIIVLTETVAAGIRQQVEMIRLERDRPLVVEIPGPAGPLAGRKSLRQFVREAVGIRVG